MKKIIAFTFMVSMIAFNTASFAQSKNTPAKTSSPASYGAKIDAAGAIDASALTKQMGDKQTMNVKVRGKIKEVCQRKGCWMNIDLGNGQDMMVSFKDYAFFVPKDVAGKTVVMEGVAKKEEVPVEDLKEHAKDAGKSKAEIEKINTPEKSTTFEASGVLIYND